MSLINSVRDNVTNTFYVFLISNFCCVLNVVCFLLGNSPASELYMLTFRNTLSVPSSYLDSYEKWLGLRMLEYLYGKRFGSKIAWANRKECDRAVAGPRTRTRNCPLLGPATALYSDPPLPCHTPSYWLRLFSNQTFSHINTSTFSNPVIIHIYSPMKMEQSVPKRRHVKFRRWRITQKKAYNMLHTCICWYYYVYWNSFWFITESEI